MHTIIALTQGELAIQKADFSAAVDQLRKAKRMVGFGMTFGAAPESTQATGPAGCGAGWVAGMGATQTLQVSESFIGVCFGPLVSYLARSVFIFIYVCLYWSNVIFVLVACNLYQEFL